MKQDIKDRLAEDFQELIKKYRDKLKAGEIADLIISSMSIMIYSLSFRSGEAEMIEDDLIQILRDSINTAKCYFEFHNLKSAEDIEKFIEKHVEN